MLVTLVQTDALAAVVAGGIHSSSAIKAVARALEANESRIPDDIGEMEAAAIDIFRYATEEGRARPYWLCGD